MPRQAGIYPPAFCPRLAQNTCHHWSLGNHQNRCVISNSVTIPVITLTVIPRVPTICQAFKIIPYFILLTN